MWLNYSLLDRNEVLKAIKFRRSVRMFSEKAVSEDHINTLLQAANHAPSAHNQQSWRFFVLKGEKKSQLVSLVSSKSAELPKPVSVLLRMASRTIQEAPAVIAVANSGELIKHGKELFKIDDDTAYDFFRTMEIQSSAAAVQNILLAATSLGIGAVWLGVLYIIKDEVLKFLEEPKGEFMAVIPIGFASKPMTGPRKRPLETFVKNLD